MNQLLKVFVLKQSWRPCEVDSERDLYEKSECHHVGKIERCEEVLISGKKDATDTLIWQALDDLTGPGDEMWEGEDPSIHVTHVGDIEEVIARDKLERLGLRLHEFGRGCFYRHHDMGG